MQSSTIPITSSFHTPTKKSFPYNFSPHNDSPNHTLPKSEIFQPNYGKVKGIEILSFKGAEVERTSSDQTSFVAAGTLHVLYFEAYNRFILSLNDWKYALLRRLPVISSDTRLQGPVSYTLPTCDGFYTLRLIGVENLASLKNFETILANSSKFSFKETVNNSSYKKISTSSDYSDFEHATPNPLTKSDRWKRGIRKFNSRLTNSFKKSTKPNLNLYQTRDFESLKKTNEMMAPLHLLPKKDIESLLSLSKSVASQYGFEPEAYSSGLQNCQITPIAYRKDAHGAFTNPFASPSPTRGGITASPQPDMTSSIGHMAGNHAINPKNYGISQPKLIDRIRAKLPGEHHYYGEKVPGEKLMAHSHGTLKPRRTVKEVLERNIGGTGGNARNDESLIDSFMTDQEPYEMARSPQFGEVSHEGTLEIARQRSLELVQKYTNDYLAHKERMSRFSTQSKREEENNSIPSTSFGPELETVDTSPAEKDTCDVQIDSRLVGSREAKGLRKRVAMKIDYNDTENILDLDSILRSEGFEQCEG